MTSDNGSMYMPVAPAYGAGNAGGFGFDGFGGGWGLLILLAVLGWGNGGFGFGGGNANGMMPWMMGNSDVQHGFDQSAVMNGIAGVHNAVNGVAAGVANGFAQAEIAANARQMADMQQNFNLLQAQQNCCCENRQATADLKYTVANEAALTRASSSADSQKIMDKLCQLELDNIKQNYENRIAALENSLAQERANNQSLRFAAAEGRQTATILADNANQTTALEQYLAPTPRPAYVVQNPNCCQQNFNCGYAA